MWKYWIFDKIRDFPAEIALVSRTASVDRACWQRKTAGVRNSLVPAQGITYNHEILQTVRTLNALYSGLRGNYVPHMVLEIWRRQKASNLSLIFSKINHFLQCPRSDYERLSIFSHECKISLQYIEKCGGTKIRLKNFCTCFGFNFELGRPDLEPLRIHADDVNFLLATKLQRQQGQNGYQQIDNQTKGSQARISRAMTSLNHSAFPVLKSSVRLFLWCNIS